MSEVSASSSSPAFPAAARHGARGICMVLLAAMLWGTTGTVQSLAPAGLSPYWVGALRLAVATAFFAVLAGVLRRRGGPRGRLAWPQVLLAGACVAVYNLSFFAGIRISGVALGTALAIGSGPIWAGLLQTVLQRRMPAPVWWAGTLLGVAGGVAMALDGGAGSGSRGGAQALVGIALCLLAGLGYSAYTLLNKPLVQHAPAPTVNLAVFGTAAVLSVPMAWVVAGTPALTAGTWATVAYLGLVATGLAYLLFTSALRHISGATGVTLALAEPVTAFVLAVVVVGEPATLLSVGGLVAVLSGLLLVVWAELRVARS